MTYECMLLSLCNLYLARIEHWETLPDEAKKELVYIAKFWQTDGEFIRKSSFSLGINTKPIINEQSAMVKAVCLGTWEDIKEHPTTIKRQVDMLFNGKDDFKPELKFEGTFEEYKDWEI